VEHTLSRRRERSERRIEVGHPEREMREPALVHRPAPRWRPGGRREVKQLDTNAVPLEIHGLQLDAPQTQQRVARLTRHPQLVLEAEPQQIAIEPQRPLHVGDADPDVGQPKKRNHRVELPRMTSPHHYASIVTLIAPVVLSAAVRNPRAISASGTRCVITVSAMCRPCRRRISRTMSKSARAPARP